jgi:hypothetical protein
VPSPAALSSSPASSPTEEHPIFTHDTGTDKISTTTNWVFNDDKSNNDNYTYTSGLVSSPLILPIDDAHTTNTNLTIHSGGGIVNSFSQPSRQINTKDISDNAITTPKIANNAITEAKLSRDAVHVAWPDDTMSGNSEILYRKSTDRGTTFGSTVNLSISVGGSESPAIDVSGNNVHVVWLDNTPGNSEILLRKSINMEATFGSTINVSQNSGSSELPAISVSPKNF